LSKMKRFSEESAEVLDKLATIISPSDFAGFLVSRHGDFAYKLLDELQAMMMDIDFAEYDSYEQWVEAQRQQMQLGFG
jgi:hypothetical protein